MIKAKIVFSIFLTFTTVSLFAGLPPSSCGDVNARNTLFNTFIMQTRGTTKQQRDAIKTARSFVRIYGNCPDPNSRSAASTVRDWQKQNDNAVELAFFDAVNNNPAQAFAAAQPLLTAHSDDLGLQLALVLAGVKLLKAGDHSHIAESLAASQAALKLIESGKTTDDWAPFTTAQDAPDGLRYYSAVFCAETAPEQAVANLLEVTRSKNTFSADATTYQLLGGLTYKTEVEPLITKYQSTFAGKAVSPEGNALRDQVNQKLDKVITCYARAVALSDGKETQSQLNASARKALDAVYTQRHDGSKDGLEDVIKSALRED
ncbi:MAG TPA: hypothetical protein VII75_15295 [Thermoanaerobaculia bacterium]|nr:hypothetical protein [Thermoanaerobaculia bacterium]